MITIEKLRPCVCGKGPVSGAMQFGEGRYTVFCKEGHVDVVGMGREPVVTMWNAAIKALKESKNANTD